MSILTGAAIKQAVEKGEILIDPFDPSRVGPNSYDVALADELFTLKGTLFNDAFGERTLALLNLNGHDRFVDVGAKQELVPVIKRQRFDNNHIGWLLFPGILYLGRTVEHTSGGMFVPNIDGRSSIGRCGVSLHVTAGR